MHWYTSDPSIFRLLRSARANRLWGRVVDSHAIAAVHKSLSVQLLEQRGSPGTGPPFDLRLSIFRLNSRPDRFNSKDRARRPPMAARCGLKCSFCTAFASTESPPITAHSAAKMHHCQTNAYFWSDVKNTGLAVARSIGVTSGDQATREMLRPT